MLPSHRYIHKLPNMNQIKESYNMTEDDEKSFRDAIFTLRYIFEREIPFENKPCNFTQFIHATILHDDPKFSLLLNRNIATRLYQARFLLSGLYFNYVMKEMENWETINTHEYQCQFANFCVMMTHKYNPGFLRY